LPTLCFDRQFEIYFDRRVCFLLLNNEKQR